MSSAPASDVTSTFVTAGAAASSTTVSTENGATWLPSSSSSPLDVRGSR